MKLRFRGPAILGIALFAGLPVRSQDVPGAGDSSRTAPVDFVRDIQPILRDSCVSCHGDKKQKGQLRLDSKISAFQGGVGGKTLVPGNAKESRLYTILLEPAAEDRMPQKADPLPREKLELLRLWIDQGAAWPDAASVAVGAERHWSTQK
ncbi:MAG TPA: c-type cytochrome domain-containing protein, partial [Planctomycetota bacterium]|nr:c-type cytochrome domain-containing protein [Planctomycetota bacterium]